MLWMNLERGRFSKGSRFRRVEIPVETFRERIIDRNNQEA
jgi:hypothetical protein